MAERVEILVVAQDAASQILRGVTSQFGALGSAVQMLTGGRVFEELAGQVVSFAKDSIDATVKYANEVRTLSMLSGESAENTSRFIQLLDDYKLSASDAETATRKLTQNGYVPNIETLATLSDKYLSLTTTQDKNKFMLDNLGRSGVQWAEILSLGSEEIRKQSAAIDAHLILTQKELDQARELEFAQDNWNDTMEATKIELGTSLLPALTALTATTLEASKATEENVKWYERLIPAVGAIHSLFLTFTEAINYHNEAKARAVAADAELAENSKKTAEDLKLEKMSVEDITKATESFLSTVSTLTGDLEGYEQKQRDIQQALNDGKITQDEAAQKWKALADEQEKASRRMILNMLQQQMAADGLSEAETAYLLDTGLAWGVYSQAAVDQAKKAQQEVKRLSDEFNSVPEHKTSTIDIIKNYVSNFFTNDNSSGGRAGGGDVSAGELYRVNETRTEYFKPANNGTIIPLGGASGSGSGVTIVYSPQMSLGTFAEFQSNFAPLIEKAVRSMQSDNRVGL